MRDTVYIIAGGNSLQGFDFASLEGCETIVVNKALFNVKNPTYFVTMDYSFLRKCPGAVQQLPASVTKVFVAALDVPYLVEEQGIIVDTRSKLVYDLSPFDIVIKSKHKNGLGRNWNHFCTGWNSGFCALQFAVIMGYRRIVLLGIDLNTTGKTHYHGGYGESVQSFNKKLIAYYESFKDGLRPANLNGQKIYNCSKGSKLENVIGYTPIEEALQWRHQQNRC